MLSTFSHKRVWMLVVAAGIAALAVACAAEEAAEPAQPAPAAPAAQPQAAGAVEYPETQAPAAQQRWSEMWSIVKIPCVVEPSSEHNVVIL